MSIDSSFNNLPASDKRRKSRHLFEEHAAEALKSMEEADSLKSIDPYVDYAGFHRREALKNTASKLRRKVEALAADLYVDNLSNSLGHIVALATAVNNGDTEIMSQIGLNTAKVFKSMILSQKISPERIVASESPHLAVYLGAIRDLSVHQAKVTLNEAAEDAELMKSTAKTIKAYESKLAEVVNVKSRVMLHEERKLEQKFKAGIAAAQESAMFPEHAISKMAKQYNSYFRKILDVHSEAALRDSAASEGAINKEKLVTEALITYNILELLHTSKLASKADLSFI